MMEEFLRDNLGGKYGDLYKNGSKELQTEIELGLLTYLAHTNTNQPINIQEETVLKNGHLKKRYILEVELEPRKS